MLKPQDNERLTRGGPGTPAGALLRRYWQPALMSSELPEVDGAPLRLLIPVKYGVKNLKRIGKITFSDERPHDYWAENGYDYDSGF